MDGRGLYYRTGGGECLVFGLNESVGVQLSPLLHERATGTAPVRQEVARRSASYLVRFADRLGGEWERKSLHEKLFLMSSQNSLI
jgi:hypothetical protein